MMRNTKRSFLCPIVRYENDVTMIQSNDQRLLQQQFYENQSREYTRIFDAFLKSVNESQSHSVKKPRVYMSLREDSTSSLSNQNTNDSLRLKSLNYLKERRKKGISENIHHEDELMEKSDHQNNFRNLNQNLSGNQVQEQSFKRVTRSHSRSSTTIQIDDGELEELNVNDLDVHHSSPTNSLFDYSNTIHLKPIARKKKKILSSESITQVKSREDEIPQRVLRSSMKNNSIINDNSVEKEKEIEEGRMSPSIEKQIEEDNIQSNESNHILTRHQIKLLNSKPSHNESNEMEMDTSSIGRDNSQTMEIINNSEEEQKIIPKKKKKELILHFPSTSLSQSIIPPKPIKKITKRRKSVIFKEKTVTPTQLQQNSSEKSKHIDLISSLISLRKKKEEIGEEYEIELCNKWHMDRMMMRCLTITLSLQDYPESEPFRVEVDPIQLNVLDYYSIIKKPIDLQYITNKITKHLYSSPEEYRNDMILMFENAKKYNQQGNVVHEAAIYLLKEFNKMYRDYIILKKPLENFCILDDIQPTYLPITIRAHYTVPQHNLLNTTSENSMNNINYFEDSAEIEYMKYQLSQLTGYPLKRKRLSIKEKQHLAMEISKMSTERIIQLLKIFNLPKVPGKIIELHLNDYTEEDLIVMQQIANGTYEDIPFLDEFIHTHVPDDERNKIPTREELNSMMEMDDD